MMDNWWEDLELMRRLLRYHPESGMIYCRERSPCDFYDTGEGSSFVSAAGGERIWVVRRLIVVLRRGVLRVII